MKGVMKGLKGFSILSLVLACSVWFSPGLREAFGLSLDDASLISQAYSDRVSNIMVETEAVVRALKPNLDDIERHQNFVIELENGHQLEVLHNLDLARGVPVKPGAIIRLRGEYDWTPRGGVIHWTHNDPAGEREGGWIEYQGRKYF